MRWDDNFLEHVAGFIAVHDENNPGNKEQSHENHDCEHPSEPLSDDSIAF